MAILTVFFVFLSFPGQIDLFWRSLPNPGYRIFTFLCASLPFVGLIRLFFVFFAFSWSYSHVFCVICNTLFIFTCIEFVCLCHFLGLVQFQLLCVLLVISGAYSLFVALFAISWTYSLIKYILFAIFFLYSLVLCALCHSCHFHFLCALCQF